MAREQGGGYLARPEPSGLADVVEVVLDKGVVIDAYARVSLIGIEVLTVDARIVISSVDTYLRFAEATNRLDLYDQDGASPAEMLTEGAETVVEKVASNVVEHKVDDVVDRVGNTLGEPAEKLVRGAGAKLIDVAEDVAHKFSDAGDKSDEDQ